MKKTLPILAAILAVLCCAAALAVDAASTDAALAAGGARLMSSDSEVTAAGNVEPPAPVFHIQLWDAQKTGWDGAVLDRVAAAGFTVVQNGYRDSFFPSRQLLDKVRARGLLYGAYIDTRGLFNRDATPREKESVKRVVEADGKVRSSEYNTFDPTYQAIVERAMKRAIEGLRGAEGLYKIMINSERNAPLSYDDLTAREAQRAGVMTRAGERIPVYNRGVFVPAPAGMNVNFAEPWRFLMWFDCEGGDRPVNRVAAAATREARPGILATTDPLADGFTYGQYRGMDILQDWVRVHRAPRDPLSVAYRLERLKAHVRREGKGEIWIGPQLGSKTDERSYGAPADAFEEALWLTVAFGARGVTLWGYDTLRRGNPLDDDTWSRVGKFRAKLLAEYPELIGAKDAPRACAVLLSKANQVYSKRVYYEVEDNYENFYRVLLTAHVPADVVYDEDVLAGRLASYKALFLPAIEHSTVALDAKIQEFRKAGGRVVAWPFIRPVYQDYEIAKGNIDEALDVSNPGLKSMLPHQYRAWRKAEGAKVREAVADLLDFEITGGDVVANEVIIGGERRLILVNDSRTYGRWTKETGHRLCEDEGIECEVKVGGAQAVRLPPGGVAVVKVGD